MKNVFIALLLASLPLSQASIATAADEHGPGDQHNHPASEKHDHAAQGPNGGALQDLGPFEGELVVKNGALTLYLTDHAKKPAAASALKASVLVIAGNARQGPFQLAPAGNNSLSGKADAPLSAGARAIVTLTLSDGKTVQARYSFGG